MLKVDIFSAAFIVMMKYVSGVWRELLLQGLTALLAKQPVTGNEVKLNFAFPLLSMSLE